MKKSLENKLDKKLGEKLSEEIKKDVKREIGEKVDAGVREVEKRVEEEIDKKVEKEVRKRLSSKIYTKTIESSLRFKNEFQKHTATAITAALAFLIALSWRTPIQNLVNFLIEKLGLVGKAIYIEFLSALIITFIAVLVLMWFSRWDIKN